MVVINSYQCGGGMWWVWGWYMVWWDKIQNYSITNITAYCDNQGYLEVKSVMMQAWNCWCSLTQIPIVLHKVLTKDERIYNNKNIARVRNCPDITILLLNALFVFLSFCQMSEESQLDSQVSEVTLCVKILKWRSLTEWITTTKVRFRV